MKTYLLLAILGFTSCSKVENDPQELTPFKTDMQATLKYDDNKDASGGIILNGVLEPFSGSKRVRLSEGDEVEILAKPLSQDVIIKVSLGGKNIIDDLAESGSTYTYKTKITKQLVDSIGALTWE